MSETDVSETAASEAAAAQLPVAPVVLAIAGCSGSGKTTLAAELARTLGGVHFHFDNYYRDLSHLPMEARARENFNDPALLESPLLIKHVTALAAGKSIERPLYDFATYIRISGQTETVQATRFLLVEGLFALHYEALLPLFDLRVYVDTPDGVCFERRLKRDMEQRGRTAESVAEQYERTVRPASIAWVRPSARHADLTVDGADALDWKVERVLTEMRAKALWPRGL